MNLDSMKYAELRGLAKELGLKANMKAEKLLKAIKKYYEENNTQEEEQVENKEDDVGAAVQEDNVNAKENEDVSKSSALFVNTRRGKGNGTKRKISDIVTAAEFDAGLAPIAAEVDTAVAASSAPVSASSAKKRRVSSTKDSDKPESGAPVVSEEEQQQVETEKAPKVAKAGKIPRLKGNQQKTKPALKPVTPNFKKLHEAHFKKLESIDSYVQRKTKQMETYKTSVNELKKLSEKTKQQLVDGKPQTKTNLSRASMLSPVPANKKAAEDRRRHTLLSASKAPPKKPAAKEEVTFRPSVLSTRRINVRFSEATKENDHKKSMVKTPARMSACLSSSTPQKPSAKNVKTPAVSATKTPATFVFTGNTSMTTTPGTQKINFDLKASLSRPLSYKPHTGKLKPFGETKENTEANKSLVVNSHQKNYKQHQVQTRGERRVKQVEDRKQKKENLLGARRGLAMV